MGKIEEIEERLNKATPGPWFHDDYSVAIEEGVSGGCHKNNHKVICNTYDGEYVQNPNHRNDAEYIANSIIDIPFLLSRLQIAEDGLNELWKMTKDAPFDLYENKDRIMEVRAVVGTVLEQIQKE
jgi:hypothetical protein